MNILLIYPPKDNLIFTAVPEFINKARGFFPPLGLLYLASYLNKYSDHNVTILDTQVEGLTYEDIKKKIIDIKPDLVGVHALTNFLVDALNMVKITKEVSRDIITVIGGPHLSLYPEETLSFNKVDYIVIGEAERSFMKLVNNISSGDKNFDIEGVGYKNNGQLVINRTPGFIANLDELPIPERTMVPYQKYYYVLSKSRPVTTMITSRGCPYRCAFCHESNSTFREVSPKNVITEIQKCLDLDIKEIFILDDTFTVNRAKVVEICEQIISKKLIFNWQARGRVDTVDKGLLLLMKKAGCNRISFGVESGSQKIIDKLEKGIKLEQIHEVFRYAKEARLTTLADFMFGSPDEGRGDIKKSVDLMKKIAPDYIQLSITTPYPGTKLYRIAQEKGLISGDPWNDFARNPSGSFIPPIWEENLSRDEITALVNSAYKSYYLTPKFIFKNVFNITTIKNLPSKVGAFLRLLKLKK